MQDPLREVEDEGPGLNEIIAIAHRRGAESREGTGTRKDTLAQRTVIRADRVEGRPVPSAGVVERGAGGRSGRPRSGEIRADEQPCCWAAMTVPMSIDRVAMDHRRPDPRNPNICFIRTAPDMTSYVRL